MDCKEREELWDAYNRALDQFSAVVDDLPLTPARELGLQMELCRLANKRAKATRLAWQARLYEHLCDHHRQA